MLAPELFIATGRENEEGLDRVVVREDHAALTSVNKLVGLRGDGGHDAEGAAHTAVIRTAVAVGRVLEQLHLVLLADLEHAVHVRDTATHVRQDKDHLAPCEAACFQIVLDAFLEAVQVDGQFRGCLNELQGVPESRHQARRGHRVEGECIGVHPDLVAGVVGKQHPLHTLQPEADGNAATVQGDGVLHAHVLGHPLLALQQEVAGLLLGLIPVQHVLLQNHLHVLEADLLRNLHQPSFDGELLHTVFSAGGVTLRQTFGGARGQDVMLQVSSASHAE
mmetsp:Transcript_98890/g.235885  ORF Transcript_98890/g.235885 Transcript_98890/m.235885 type:complete len:278 (-) Transcript_98890:62-895(-)